MKWLKNLLAPKQNSSSFSKPSQKSPVRTPYGPQAHARHLDFLNELDGDINQSLNRAYQNVVSGPTSRAIQSGSHFHIVDGKKELMMSALILKAEVLTTVPYHESKDLWPVSVAEVLPWSNGTEGLLKLIVNKGAGFCLYDHFFFANSSSYKTGETKKFSVSGLAYEVNRMVLPEDFSQDFCGYMPIAEADGGSEDELRFMTRVQDLREFDFQGVPFLAIKVCLAKVDGFDMITTIFCSKKSAPVDLAVGDTISGMAWMFGQLMS